MIQIDMQMPTNCLDCPACNEYLMCAIPVNGRKWGENDVREFGQGRPEWCPMKEQEETKTIICPKCGDEIEIKWSLLTKPDMEAIAKRDAFLSEENGKKRKGCNHVSSKKKKQLV